MNVSDYVENMYLTRAPLVRSLVYYSSNFKPANCFQHPNSIEFDHIVIISSLGH